MMNKPFKVGQIWETRDGGRREITQVRYRGTWCVTSNLAGIGGLTGSDVQTHRKDGTAGVTGQHADDLMAQAMTPQERAEEDDRYNVRFNQRMAASGADLPAAPANFPVPADPHSLREKAAQEARRRLDSFPVASATPRRLDLEAMADEHEKAAAAASKIAATQTDTAAAHAAVAIHIAATQADTAAAHAAVAAHLRELIALLQNQT